MWEAIAANRRRSILLIALMGLVLVTLGACIGMYYVTPFFQMSASEPEVEAVLAGALAGAAVAGVAWLVLWLTAVSQGDKFLLRSAGAQRIHKRDDPRLWNVVEEMTIAAGLGSPPRVFLVEDHVPNAFAVGRTPEKAAVAVTSGLLRLFSRDELQGVVAHEIAHVKNLDIRFMTLAAVLAGSVEAISRGFFYGAALSGGRRGGRSKGGHPYLLLLVFGVAIFAPIAVRLLYLACSRQREYLADASAARFTRFPEGLASGLEKIAVHSAGTSSKLISGALVPLCIVNPLEKVAASGWLSTHPPTESRIKILRSMGGGASYVDYEAAMRKIEGRKSRLAALEAAAQADERVEARQAFHEPDADSPVGRARQVADLLDRFAAFTLLPCACGMRIKVPPEFNRASVTCPRCERTNAVPAAVPASTNGAEGEAADKAGKAPPKPDLPGIKQSGEAFEYTRRNDGWDSFRCHCGQTIQLGPSFPLDYTACVRCGQRIELRGEIT